MKIEGGRVVYFRILDPTYPRNRRIREHLASLGIEVMVVPNATGRHRLVNHIVDAARLWRSTKRGDIVVVAEMFTRYAPIAALIARWRGCALVVDGFIGIHETAVGDWAVARPRSLRALQFRLQDAFARRVADLYLIDTRVRAEAIERSTVRPAEVLSLPVGAPAWATPRPPSSSGGHATSPRLRVLYYGGYIPLHGVDVVIDALTVAVRHRDIAATFIGEGRHRASMEAHVEAAGLSAHMTFVGNVSENELADRIADHDVVLGVFGSSEKAAGVIANKVWQGAACGRTVITRESPALAEISGLLGERLVTVAGRNEVERTSALAAALVEAPGATELAGNDPSPAVALERYVQTEYAGLTAWLAKILANRNLTY